MPSTPDPLLMILLGVRLQAVIATNGTSEECYTLYNVRMRSYCDGELSEKKGDHVQIRCGLGIHSLSFDEDYPTSVAGKVSKKRNIV